jgi:hypothetical protein
MHRVGRNNPEYMDVLTKVVEVLRRNLCHPKLPDPTSAELTSWLNHVSEDEVSAALERITGERRQNPRTVLQFPKFGSK